jgi:cation:H+ antiporter
VAAVPTAILLLLSGAVVLSLGVAGAMSGVLRLARAHGASAFVLGVALLGLDLGVLVAALTATVKGQTAMAGGVAVGGVAFVLGIGYAGALFASREPVEAPSPTTALPPLGALVLSALALRDLYVSRGEGIALVAAFVIYLIFALRDPHEPTAHARTGEVERLAGEPRRLHVPDLLLAVAGLVLIVGGAILLVQGGAGILDHTGLAAGFIGAAIVGSLAAAHGVRPMILATRRGHPGIAAGIVTGVVASSSTLVLGIAALVRPLTLDSSVSVAAIAVGVLYTIVAMAFVTRRRAGIGVCVALVVVFAAWLTIASRY